MLDFILEYYYIVIYNTTILLENQKLGFLFIDLLFEFSFDRHSTIFKKK